MELYQEVKFAILDSVMNINVNVRELLRCLRIETYLKDARANRKETHVW